MYSETEPRQLLHRRLSVGMNAEARAALAMPFDIVRTPALADSAVHAALSGLSFSSVNRHHNARPEPMLLEKVEQISSVNQLNRLRLCERERVRAIPRCRDEDALVRPLVLHGPVQIADRRHADRVPISLRLDDHLATEHRARVERDTIDAAVARAAVVPAAALDRALTIELDALRDTLLTMPAISRSW